MSIIIHYPVLYGKLESVSDIHAHDGAGCDWIRIFRLDDEIEVPASLATNQLGLFGLARRHDATLMLAQHHRDGDAARKGIGTQALTRKTTPSVTPGCFPGEFGHKEVPSGNSRNRNPKETFSRKNDNHCQPEPILAGSIE